MKKHKGVGEKNARAKNKKKIIKKRNQAQIQAGEKTRE